MKKAIYKDRCDSRSVDSKNSLVPVDYWQLVVSLRQTLGKKQQQQRCASIMPITPNHFYTKIIQVHIDKENTPLHWFKIGIHST